MIEPKPAATVAVARDADAGLEVLLLKRTRHAVFMPGYFVFPGGAVDAADHQPLPPWRTGGVDQAAASRMIGVLNGGLAFLQAAIRECFEEAGLLLAERGDDQAPAGVPDIDLASWRRRLAAGELSLVELCEQLELVVHADRMVYLSHWVTPPGLPRRYDTRFFVVPAPPGQRAGHDGSETVDHLWITPDEALSRQQRGEFPLATPTIRTLHTLTGFAGTAQLLDHARRRLAPAVAAPLSANGPAGSRLVAPHEPAYHEIAKLRREGLGPAACELVPGVVQRLSRRVRRLTAANPGMMTGPGTNTYLVGDADGLAVIDPGPDLTGHLDAIIEAAAAPIRWILATHTHPDHSPGVRPLKQRTGAQVLGMPPPEGDSQDHSFKPDRVPGDGERLRIGAATLKAIHTPGHASNHLCYLLEDERILFSGDHVMQGSTVVISPPDGNMQDYLDALNALQHEEIAYIAPGHGFLIGEPYAAIDRIVTHRQAREAKVLAAIKDLAPVAEPALLAAVYEDVPVALHGVAGRSLKAHLIKLRDDGVAVEHGSLWHLRG